MLAAMGKDVRRDRILFVDVEMTCWEGPPPEGERSEVIEIGLVEVDNADLAVVRSGSLLCLPRASTISPYCTALTGITPEEMKARGVPFGDACNGVMKRFGSRNKAWFAWGSDDEAIRAECLLKGAAYPFSGAFINLGLMTRLLVCGERRLSLEEASAAAGHPPFKAHRAEPDAAATAAVYLDLARRWREIAPRDQPTVGLTS